MAPFNIIAWVRCLQPPSLDNGLSCHCRPTTVLGPLTRQQYIWHSSLDYGNVDHNPLAFVAHRLWSLWPPSPNYNPFDLSCPLTMVLRSPSPDYDPTDHCFPTIVTLTIVIQLWSLFPLSMDNNALSRMLTTFLGPPSSENNPSNLHHSSSTVLLTSITCHL